MPYEDPDLWTCPSCGEKLVSRNMSHSCGRYRLEDLFVRSEPTVWETYKALERMALEVAPFHIIPQKTRMCFQLRMRCINGTPRKASFVAGFILPQIGADPRFHKIETYNPRQHGHYVHLRTPADVDGQVREWIELSTLCGEQKNA